MIVHVSSDLMAASGLSSEARSRGVPIKLVANTQAVVKLLTEEQVDLLVVDLQTSNLKLDELVGKVRSTADEVAHVSLPLIVVYAQHVMTDLIERAKSLNVDIVMTRGQFSQQTADLVNRVCEKDVLEEPSS